MVRILIFVVALSVLTAPRHTSGQEGGVERSRDLLRQSSCYFNYPGGMLFHTAFHRALTTRYVLLKSAKQCPALKRYLELDANQMEIVDKLRPLRVDLPSKKGVADLNAQPDEQVLDPNYFGFMSSEQLARLDLVAFRFDGYAALTRGSMATRVELSGESKAKIEAAIARMRETIFLPRFRSQFATQLPSDTGFRECQFAGAFVTQVNSRIGELLTEAECSRVHQLIVSKIDHDLIREVEKVATLPDGVLTLAKTLTEDELYGE